MSFKKVVPIEIRTDIPNPGRGLAVFTSTQFYYCAQWDTDLSQFMLQEGALGYLPFEEVVSWFYLPAPDQMTVRAG